MPDARTNEPKPYDNTEQNDWRLTLPEQWTAPTRDASGAEVQIPLRKHPALAKYSSKDEAIKALVHAQRLLGKKGDPAQPDMSTGSLLSLAACPAGQACPASPADYQLPDIELPETFSVDEALRDAFLAKAHELGLSDAQAGGLFAWFVPLNAKAVVEHGERQHTERLSAREREMHALRQVHGGAATSVLEAARKAVLALGGKELMQRLETSGAADDARVVQAFARMAPLVSETSLRGRDAAPAQGLTPQRLREMMRDPRYHDPSQRDEEYVRQVQQGFDALYPGEKQQNSRADM